MVNGNNKNDNPSHPPKKRKWRKWVKYDENNTARTILCNIRYQKLSRFCLHSLILFSLVSLNTEIFGDFSIIFISFWSLAVPFLRLQDVKWPYFATTLSILTEANTADSPWQLFLKAWKTNLHIKIKVSRASSYLPSSTERRHKP